MLREIYLLFFIYEFCNKTHYVFHFHSSLVSAASVKWKRWTSLLMKNVSMLNRLISEFIWPRAESWGIRGFSGWSKLIFSYLEVQNVLLEFISEMSFRPLHSTLNYFREFKSLDSGLFFNTQTYSNTFHLLPWFVCKALWSKRCVWSPKLLSSNCFAVIFHVSPCSEYSLWWVVKIMQFLQCFVG